MYSTVLYWPFGQFDFTVAVNLMRLTLQPEQSAAQLKLMIKSQIKLIKLQQLAAKGCKHPKLNIA